MPRVISFLVLLTIVLLVAAVFFRVMAQFFVPLFLAAVLLVVFQPLHSSILGRIPNHPRLSALLTTVAILLTVLLPLTLLGWKAYFELKAMLAASNNAATQVAAAPTNPDLPPDELSEERESLALGERLKKMAKDLAAGFERVTHVPLTGETMGKLIDKATVTATNLVISGVQSAIGVTFGLVIMVVALYYFLADGPAMIRTVMDLSPLEAAYEQELLERFGQVSRAVVVATLLSAVVQGVLAGIGYYFALPSTAPIFLLTVSTMITALVPFLGAAIVWVLVCIWIYLYGPHQVDGVTQYGDWPTALALAIYSTIVVSGVDNIIKPYVLRGQSNLHPLLALLSILGGVATLGPVGIIVGPMVIVFLQALLEMLRKELDSFGQAEGGMAAVLAEAGGASAIAPPAAAAGGTPAPPAARSLPARSLPTRRKDRRKK